MKKFTVLGIAAISVGATLMGISLISGRSAASVAPAEQEAFINAAESTINGVVSVKSYATPQTGYGYGDGAYFDPFEYFFGGGSQRRRQPSRQAEQQQIGLGSGVIIDKEGYIVTNNHVIADAERLEVTLNDNRNYNATVVGSDPATDLALIKIEADDLHVIPMGNSEDLHVGEWVLAVGNPFGFTSTVTSGIVSAKGRNIGASTQQLNTGSIESYIQTDAALNSGNSGGALVNLDGELVGINAAIYSKTGTYAGCSFAIPTSIVKKVVADLKEFGTVQRAFLGVSFVELTPEIIKKEGVKGVNSGILVKAVTDRSAAKEAGLAEGDVIVAVNDDPITSTATLQEAIAKCSPGDEIAITYYRDGKKTTKRVVLRNDKGDTTVRRAGSVTDLGCAFAALSKEQLAQLEISAGVQVKGLEDGAMKDAGIRDGFIVLSINGIRITSPADVEKIYNSIMKGADDKVMFIKGIYPTGKQAFYAVPLGEE